MVDEGRQSDETVREDDLRCDMLMTHGLDLFVDWR
jgi:hypothetical protein